MMFCGGGLEWSLASTRRELSKLHGPIGASLDWGVELSDVGLQRHSVHLENSINSCAEYMCANRSQMSCILNIWALIQKVDSAQISRLLNRAPLHKPRENVCGESPNLDNSVNLDSSVETIVWADLVDHRE